MKNFNRHIIALWLAVFATAIPFAVTVGAKEPTAYQFSFGTAQPPPGQIQILSANTYSTSAGYGFEPGGQVIAGNDFVTGINPFYFSIRLPEGNYRITAVLGGKEESTITVKAELRRLMLEKVHTAAGASSTNTFIVNLRTPKISESNFVHLKPREKTTEMWDWDDKLTLEFNGANPAMRLLSIEKVYVPTVFLMGDSTVCDQPAEPWNSWGQMLPRFFKPEVAIANHAESGETIADSLRAQRFEKIFSLMKPGDYLLVQFGHNDMKNHAPDALATYKSDLEKIVERTRSEGGTPVLVTSMERKNGVEQNTLMGYPQTVRDVAKEENCALIDLNAMSKVFYRALGSDLSRAFQDGTHHNNYGSYELAKCVVTGIKADKLPLAKSIVDNFGDFDPAHPDSVNAFSMPASPVSSNTKPLGN
jgi:lysophospholipase L1-like esterase